MKHILLFGVGWQHLKQKNEILFLSGETSDFPDEGLHFYNGKSPRQDYFGL